MPLPEQPKPSFFSSVMSGIAGFFKGLLAGGVVGAVAGGVIAAAIFTGITLATGGTAALAAAGWAAVGLAAGSGATIGGTALGSIGAFAGTYTGVKRSLDAAQPSAAEIMAKMNIAHQHGQMVGLQQGIQIGAKQSQQEQTRGTKFQDAEKVRDQAKAAVTKANLGH